jgi:hypothetical protein
MTFLQRIRSILPPKPRRKYDLVTEAIVKPLKSGGDKDSSKSQDPASDQKNKPDV